MLVDCMVYLGLWVVVVGLAFSAFYRSLGYNRQLSRYSDDIAVALKAGERWREDIRQATAPPQNVTDERNHQEALHILQKTNEIIYVFAEGTLFRQARTNAPWLKILPNVKSSHMQKDQRQQVAAWRWELELTTKQKNPHVQPLFSFGAVAPGDLLR